MQQHCLLLDGQLRHSSTRTGAIIQVHSTCQAPLSRGTR